MSIAVRTYADLLDRIEALAGKDSFTANEQTRILSLVNARLYSAYRRCDYWPRYFYVGEARFASNNTVPYTQASAVLVSGAGTTELNGVYQPVSTLNGKTLYYLNGVEEFGVSPSISYDGFGTWLCGIGGSEAYFADTVDDPWDGTWERTIDPGELPAPTVTEATRANIDTFFRLYTDVIYGPNSGGYELDFYVDDDGAHPINTQTEWDQLYVTYKAPWDGPYAANSTAIPLEFFEYAAHGALADWLRSAGNFDQAGAEDLVAESMLNFELMRKQVQYNAQMYAPRFRTYISQQSRNF